MSSVTNHGFCGLGRRAALAASRVLVAAILAVPGAAFAQQVVKWGVGTANLSFAPALLGGLVPEIFGKHGVRLEVVDFRGSAPNCMVGVISGETHACQGGIGTGLDAIAEGTNLKAFAFTTAPITEIAVSAKALASAKVSANAPIEQRIRALKGMRIVSSGPGTANYVLLASMLSKVGLGMQDLRFRTLGDPVAMMEGMRNDQIDAAMWSIGPLSPAESEKLAVRFINLARGDVPELRGTPFVGTFSQAAWVEKNMDLVARTQAGFADAVALLKKDDGKYFSLIKAKYAPDLPPAVWTDTYQQAKLAMLDGAKATKAGWDYLVKLQAQDSKRDYSKAAFDRTVLPFARAK